MEDEDGGQEIAETADTRRAPRDSMLLHATVRATADGSAPVPIRIRNLSAGGLMGEVELPLARNERVEVMLRNVGPVEGVVAWSVDGRIGIAFTTPVDRLRLRRPVAVKTGRPAPAAPQSRRPGLRTGGAVR